MRTTSLNMGQLDLGKRWWYNTVHVDVPGYTLGSNEIIGTPPTPGSSLRSASFSPFARASHDQQQQHGGYGDELGLLDDTPLATIAEQREDQLFSESMNHSQFVDREIWN